MIRAAELKKAGIDWVRVMLSDSVPGKALLIAKLKADSRYTEERQRVQAFREMGGGNQTTYYKWLKRIRSPINREGLKIRVCGGSRGSGVQLRVVRGA